MPRVILFLSLLSILAIQGGAQNVNLDSLFRAIDHLPADTNAFNKVLQYSDLISFNNPGQGQKIDDRIVSRARELKFQSAEAGALNSLGEDYHFMGNHVESMRRQLQALEIYKTLNNLFGQVISLGYISILYNELGQYRQALFYLFQADSIFRLMPHTNERAFILDNMSISYDALGKPDSAMVYARKAYEEYTERLNPHLKSFILGAMGNAYAKNGMTDSALWFFHTVILNSENIGDKLNLILAVIRVANFYKSEGKYDSSLFYARWALRESGNISNQLYMMNSFNILAELFDHSHQLDSANHYLKRAAEYRDSLYGPDKLNQMQVLILTEQERQNALHQQELDFRNRVKYISLIIALAVFLLLAFILFRSNRHKQRANNLLQEQKRKIEDTLVELKSAQAQLIQSEKMASLGELTAGIAHEIQNPLNFVNNFSELNRELIDEMNVKLEQGDIGDAKSMAAIIKDNLEKINHHGQRADGIVKGMLEHTRVSAGKKELTDINQLCKEYFRLAYHGQRAKDQGFHTKMETQFDEFLPKAFIISQDIGRVLLNLINNAFYSVSRQYSLITNGYEPVIMLRTKRNGQFIEICVKDNGLGISSKNLDKIFQPFFTTRPTGQGTGLGLSISYDIIKAHGGEIRVESKEGEGAEFVVALPI